MPQFRCRHRGRLLGLGLPVARHHNYTTLENAAPPALAHASCSSRRARCMPARRLQPSCSSCTSPPSCKCLDTSCCSTWCVVAQWVHWQRRRVGGHAALSLALAGRFHQDSLLLKAPRTLHYFCYLLQVGNRWDEFSAEEHSQLGTLAYNMLKSGVGRPTPLAAGRGLPCCMADPLPSSPLLPLIIARSPILAFSVTGTSMISAHVRRFCRAHLAHHRRCRCRLQARPAGPFARRPPSCWPS